MRHLKNFNLFLEDNNSNNSSNKSKVDNSPDEMDNVLKNAEEQKKKVIAQKDAIEKGLLNNIRDLEPDNQKEVQNQVHDYRNQVQEFDKTVKQIDKLNKTLKKSNKPVKEKPYIQNARDKTKL